jgi:hypothetical protein
MPTAEELKARFENRLRPGPTDERLAVSLGLMSAVAEPPSAEAPERRPDDSAEAGPELPDGASGATPSAQAKRSEAKTKTRRQAVRLVTAPRLEAEAQPETPSGDGQRRASGGEGLEVLDELFPPPPLLAGLGPEPVKVGFPVPVDLIRDMTRLKVDLSRHLGRRVSNHEVGGAAARLLPTDPAGVAELVRGHADRLGLTEQTTPRRRLVAAIPREAVTTLEDLVLAVDETEGVRVTKSQLWALAHVLLLERAGR